MKKITMKSLLNHDHFDYVDGSVKWECWNCGNVTGFGFGVEPLRYDIHWCSSECHNKFFNIPAGGKK